MSSYCGRVNICTLACLRLLTMCIDCCADGCGLRSYKDRQARLLPVFMRDVHSLVILADRQYRPALESMSALEQHAKSAKDTAQLQNWRTEYLDACREAGGALGDDTLHYQIAFNWIQKGAHPRGMLMRA